MVLDRFAEKYFEMNPYQYGANSPLKYRDANGDSLIVTENVGITMKLTTPIDRFTNIMKQEEVGNFYQTKRFPQRYGNNGRYKNSWSFTKVNNNAFIGFGCPLVLR